MPGHASSPYWTAIDFDSEAEEDTCYPHPSERVYLDPWDGIARVTEITATEEETSSVGEPVSASFYFIPTKCHDSDGDKESMEQQRLYSARRHLPPYDFVDCTTFKRKSHFEYNDLHKDMTNNFGYDVLPLAGPPRRRSMFAMEEAYYSPRPMMYESLAPTSAIPLPGIMPPPHSGIVLPPHAQLRKRISLPMNHGVEYGPMPQLRRPNVRRLSRYTDPYERCTYESVLPDYGDNYYRHPTVMNKPPPENFHLSRYGHLKIDYSLSWNSLDRLIRNQ